MSDLTSELNLALCVDNDDTADYLTQSAGLRGSLLTLDGLFSSTTGHSHSGSHQGGAINFPPPPTLETLFAGSMVNQAANYTVATTVLFVFCTAAITVTLPDAAITNRPITIAAVAGQSTVAAVTGSVIGGSMNTSTGAIMNGTVSQGDSITYKSDGTSWRAV